MAVLSFLRSPPPGDLGPPGLDRLGGGARRPREDECEEGAACGCRAREWWVQRSESQTPFQGCSQPGIRERRRMLSRNVGECRPVAAPWSRGRRLGGGRGAAGTDWSQELHPAFSKPFPPARRCSLNVTSHRDCVRERQRQTERTNELYPTPTPTPIPSMRAPRDLSTPQCLLLGLGLG